MALTVTHPFVSLEPAKTDPAEVGGADWNANHSLSGTLPVLNGGTGATTEADARTNLGLGTLATQNANNVSISGGSISGISLTSLDSSTTIQDNADPTKQMKFELSGISAGQTRTLTVPDASTTLVGQDTADSLTNKVLVDTTDLEVSNLKAKDGTAAGTITDVTGIVTLNSAVLTTADINGGTIDGVTIGASAAPTVTNLGSVATCDINGGTIDGTTQASGTINGPIAAGGTWTAAATWTLPAHTLGGTVTSNGQSFSGTIANLGTVTTVDLNGGTIDGTVIGGASAAAGTFTTLTSTGNAALGDAEATDTHAIKGATTLLANSASAALTVTQTGSGNAFVVEDSASTDSTPFVIAADGRVVVGHTATFGQLGSTASLFNVAETGTQANATFGKFRASSADAVLGLIKSRAATTGTNTVLVADDGLGQISFAGADGSNYIEGALIRAYVDGTPGTNDMPGRLVFSTTADGASSPTERMRIDSSGNVRVLEGGGSGATASTNADNLVIDSNSDSGISILAGNTSNSRLYFGDTNDNIAALVDYDHAITQFTLGTAEANGYLVFKTANDVERMRIDSSGQTTVGYSAATGVALSTTVSAKFRSSSPTYTDGVTAAAGTVAHGTINSFDNPAIAATNACTYTNASTVYIDGAPTAGTNVTLTNAYSLFVASGDSVFGSRLILSSDNIGAGNADIEAANQSIRISAGRIGVTETNASSIKFFTNANSAAPVEQVSIDSAGLLTLTAGQIKFPATQNASADANTLDDYEEGTFTPVVRDAAAGNAATANTATGRYTKIGNRVQFSIRLYNVTTAGLTAGNQVFITALPFTSLNDSTQETVMSVLTASATPTTGSVIGFIPSNVSYVTLYNSLTTGNAIFTVSQLTSGSADIWATGSYFTA